jgi:hypothetical protein
MMMTTNGRNAEKGFASLRSAEMLLREGIDDGLFRIDFCIDEKERPPPISGPSGTPPPMARTHTEGEFNTKVLRNCSEWMTASEAVKTRFGRNSEYFFQTKFTFAQKYQVHCSYLLELPRITSKASFFLCD